LAGRSSTSMQKLKIRYRSGHAVHQGNATPGITFESQPGNCSGPQPFSMARYWMANYEEILYSADRVMQFNDCTHTTFREVPNKCSSYNEHFQNDFFGNLCQSYGNNIDAHVWSTLFPHGNHEYAPNGAELAKGLQPVDDAMGGPMMEYLSSRENAFDLDKIASSALQLFGNKLLRLDEISIINFLIELKDVRRMWKDLSDLCTKNVWSELCQVASNRDRAKHALADRYLSFEFGYCPFVRDIITILKLLANWRKKLKTLLARLHKIESIRATIYQYNQDTKGEPEPISPGQFMSAALCCDGLINYQYTGAEVLLSVPNKVLPRAGMKYTLYCEELKEMNAELRGLLDAFGVRWDPSIIWNAIPFSFMLDWLWDVGAWLAKWSKPTLPVKLRIMDFYITWKYSGRVTVDILHANGNVNDVFPLQNNANIGRHLIPVERFCRRRFSPDYEHLKFAKWDKNKVDKTLLGTALLTTFKEVKRPFIRKQRFGPSDRSLKELFTVGTSDRQLKRLAAIKSAAERMTAKVNRRKWRRKKARK
jgi:hypothetical protein